MVVGVRRRVVKVVVCVDTKTEWGLKRERVVVQPSGRHQSRVKSQNFDSENDSDVVVSVVYRNVGIDGIILFSSQDESEKRAKFITSRL